MPITIKQDMMKYKNPTSGNYQSIDVVAETTTSEQIAAVAAAGSAQITAIENKGTETIESIPDDYTELSEDVEELKSALNGSSNYAVELGTWTNQGVRVSSTNRASTIMIPVSPGDKIVIKNGSYQHICKGYYANKVAYRADTTYNKSDETVVIAISGYLAVIFADGTNTSTDITIANFNGSVVKVPNIWAHVDVINEITGKTEYTYTQGGYINNSSSPVNINSVTILENMNYVVVPCSPGDVFTLTAAGANTARSWAFITSNGTIITNSGAYAKTVNEILVAPANSAYLVSNDNSGTCHLYKGGYKYDNLVRLLEETSRYSFTNNGYVEPTDGVYHSYGSGEYLATDLIPVTVGEGVNVVGSGIGEWYAWYTSSKQYISGVANLTNVPTQPLAVPTNAKYFRMSLMPSGIDPSALYVDIVSLSEVSKKLYGRIARTDIVINCVGDSVTEGMGVDGDYRAKYGKATYPARLFTILTDNGYDVVVNNYGHGGERIPDIATRIGAYPCIFTEDITIPSNNANTSLGLMTAPNGRVLNTKIAVPYKNDDYCVFFTQTNFDTNPLYIDGVEYTLTIGNNENFIKKRVSDGKQTVINAGTFLYTRNNRNPSVNIIMGGINDGSSLTLERYIDMMLACLNANGGKGIVLGSTHLLCSTWSDVTGSSAAEKWEMYHRACVNAFGNRFIDLYFEFPLHAVQIALDSGYWTDKTTDQLVGIQTKLNNHIIPGDLTVDGTEGNVHLNEVGYQIIATLVFDRLKRLNYISKPQ